MYDERFPGAPFMVSKSGLTISFFGTDDHENVTDSELIPEDFVDLPNQTGRINLESIPYPPAGFDIHVIFKYDNNFLAEFGANVESRIHAMVGHANVIFQFPSLDAKMTVIVDAIEHYDNVTEATVEDIT